MPSKKKKYVARTSFLHHEVLGTTQTVDHINGDGLDNRKENLRLASTTQNNWNLRKKTHNSQGRPCSSQYKGVFKDRGSDKWRARLTCNGKRYDLGKFDDEKAAARAWNKMAKQLYGDFAWLNAV